MDIRLPAHQIDAVRRCFTHQHMDEQFYALVETLLWRNEAISQHVIGRGPPGTGPNTNQLTLATLAYLDLDVSNGGLTQFFWNHGGWLDHVVPSLQAVGLGGLARAFDRATADLLAEVGTFIEFQKQGTLEAYAECASAFDFGEFDSAFWRQGKEVYAKGVVFVSEHLTDFVAP